MSKSYKFRAWDKVDKKWLFGYEYPNIGGFSLIGEVVLMGELSSIPLNKLIDDVEITESTGLKDKNNIEIYDQDILKCDNGLICLVFWDETKWSIKYRPFTKFEKRMCRDDEEGLSIMVKGADSFSKLRNTEKIGTYFETPELLNFKP